MDQVRYSIALDTGEVMNILEIDINRDAGVAEAVASYCDFTDLFNVVPREIIEEAKLGYSTRLKKLIRTPSIAALMKHKSPVCAMIKSCDMAETTMCSLRNISKKGLGQFPICWEPSLSGSVQAREICRSAAMAWRDGEYIILIG